MNHSSLLCQDLVRSLYQKIQHCCVAYSFDRTFQKSTLSFSEQYEKEKDILMWMIREIIRSGEYSLEGIAYHTRLPIDIISDAAMGMHKDISMTLWLRVAELYLQIK